MSSFRSSKFLDDTLEQLAALSRSCSFICSYKLCTSLVMDAFRMLPPVLPFTEFKSCHSVGSTCNSICFSLRPYTLGMRSLK